MGTPKQPNLTTDDKQLISYLLDQEYDQVNANLRDQKIGRTSKNAHKVYRKHLGKVLNKVKGNKYSYGTDL